MINMKFPSMESDIDWNGNAFEKMTNLKTFITENGHHSKSLEYLPSSLRVMKGCIPKSPSSSSSNKKFEDMKVLILNNCEYLTHIPDVSGLPNLEKFSFVRCHNLVTIHNSLRYLNRLEILNAEGCEKLESFPPLQSPSLQNLELSNCKSLKSFPELLCKMTNIKSILLKETSIEKFQSSFQNLSELSHLTISSANLKINLLKILRLDECKCFEENRAITLNPEKLSGFQCKLGHKSKGHTISFWFRKKIPSRAIILLLCLSMGINILFLTKHFAVWETRA
nr:unknown [Medicago truncatula]